MLISSMCNIVAEIYEDGICLYPVVIVRWEGLKVKYLSDESKFYLILLQLPTMAVYEVNGPAQVRFALHWPITC